MGMGKDFSEAFHKSQLAAGQRLPDSGTVFISVNDRDKPGLPEVAGNFPILASGSLPQAALQRSLPMPEFLSKL